MSTFVVNHKDSNFVDHRIALYEVLADQMRMVKLIHWNHGIAGLLHCLNDDSSMLLVLDRHDSLDQLLSWLIADRHGIPNIDAQGLQDYKHKIKPFHAELNRVRVWVDMRRGFDRLVSSLQQNRSDLHRIWYESLASDLDNISQEICNHLHIDDQGWLTHDNDGFFGSAFDGRPTKLLSLPEKQDVVLNWQVAYEHYQKLISDQI